MAITTREYLAGAGLTREMVDRFLDPAARNWAAFDSLLGYKLRDSVVNDGVDGSYTVSRYSPSGERRMVNFTDQTCRINTYGDSFTQCQQVNDGESWQEYLAAHLCEPIRNFGVGGYSVYQAYLRMLREEGTGSSSEYVILNIWSDDHLRSIYKWRWLVYEQSAWSRARKEVSSPRVWGFDGGPRPHLRLDPETGRFEERQNPYTTPESLYLLCDPDHVYEALVDEFDVQAILAQQSVTDVNTEVLQKTAEALEMPTDFGSPEAISGTGRELLQVCALHSSMHITDKAVAFAQAEGKKLMVLLSYSSEDVIKACGGGPRFDQAFVDYLEENKILFVDSLHKHVEDFSTFSVSPKEYAGLHYIGHYNPRGNHFFAFAIKDEVVGWLDPKPPTYRNSD